MVQLVAELTARFTFSHFGVHTIARSPRDGAIRCRIDASLHTQPIRAPDHRSLAAWSSDDDAIASLRPIPRSDGGGTTNRAYARISCRLQDPRHRHEILA